MSQDKLLVAFIFERSSIGNNQIREMTLNMSLMSENGDEILRQEFNPRILHYTSGESSSLSLTDHSSDSAIGNLVRPNQALRNAPYEADDESHRDSVSWYSETSNQSRQRLNEINMMRLDRNNARMVSKEIFLVSLILFRIFKKFIIKNLSLSLYLRRAVTLKFLSQKQSLHVTLSFTTVES